MVFNEPLAVEELRCGSSYLLPFQLRLAGLHGFRVKKSIIEELRVMEKVMGCWPAEVLIRQWLGRISFEPVEIQAN